MTVVNPRLLWRKQDPNTTLLKVKLALADLLYCYQKNSNKDCCPPSIDHCINRMGLKIPMPHQDVHTNTIARWPLFNKSRTRYNSV